MIMIIFYLWCVGLMAVAFMTGFYFLAGILFCIVMTISAGYCMLFLMDLDL